MYLLMARLINAGHRRHLVILTSAFGIVVFIGAGLFALTQQIPFTSGLYWAITTATTVGYGDVTPHNPSGRIVASVVMLTAIPMLGAIFAVMAGVSVSAGLRRIMQLDSHFPAGTYRLIVGMHPTVPAIIAELVETRDTVVLVADIDPSTMPGPVHVIRGDPTDSAIIRRAKPAGAQHALVTAESDGDVVVSAVLLRQQAPTLSMTALTNSDTVRHALEVLGVEQTLSVDALVAHTLAKSLETPHAGRLVEELIDSDEHQLLELPAGAELVGKPLSAIRQEYGGLVLGLVRDGSVSMGIINDPVLAVADQLLVVEALDTGKSEQAGTPPGL